MAVQATMGLDKILTTSIYYFDNRYLQFITCFDVSCPGYNFLQTLNSVYLLFDTMTEYPSFNLS